MANRLYKLRHSTAHVMAEAVLEMFPEGKLAFGPPIENGFYYDFDLSRPLSTDDLAEIEERMKEIIKGKYPFEHRDLSVDEAKEMFADQPYKIDQIENLASGRRGRRRYGSRRPRDLARCRSTRTAALPTSAGGRTWTTRARSRWMRSSC